MRKKQLIEDNMNLFKQLGDAKTEINELKEEIKKLKALMEREKEIDEKPISQPLKELEKKVQNNLPNMSEDFSFASEIIGEIVVESARYSNILTADGETKYKELVNLVLGRAEVAKAEILAITKENVSLDDKKRKMTSVKDNAIEYFEVVMAQRQ